ncbi:Lipoprotein LipO precursor [compost metagenome]
MYKETQRGVTQTYCRFFLAIIMVIVFTSCTASDAPSPNNQSDDRPLISIMTPLHFTHPPSQEMIQQIERLTNTRLDISWVPDGIYTDKINTALTTNSLKKATFVKYTDLLLVKNEIKSGAFWEIGPYLKEFPNLKHLDAEILNQGAINDKIYGLYTERPSSRQGIIIREDWLEKLKLNKPKTIDELYEVMRQFTYGDPDGNGAADTIGLVDRNDLVFGAFKTLSSYLGTPNNWQVSENRLQPEFETEPYMNTMKFMKKLYNEKIINQDFAVSSKAVQRDKIIRGFAGVYIGSMLDVQRIANETKAINPGARFTLVNRIEGPSGLKVWSIPNYNGLYVFSKKAIKTEEELKQILSFFDRTMERDVANLMKYGMEGKHHTVVGQTVQLPEKTSQLRENEVNALYMLMIADLSNPNVLPIAQEETLTAMAEKLSTDNEQFLVKDPTVNLESSTYDEKGIQLYKIIYDATYNYILGNLNDEGFRKEVEKWKQNGGSQIIEEYSKAYFKK